MKRGRNINELYHELSQITAVAQFSIVHGHRSPGPLGDMGSRGRSITNRRLGVLLNRTANYPLDCEWRAKQRSSLKLVLFFPEFRWDVFPKVSRSLLHISFNQHGPPKWAQKIASQRTRCSGPLCQTALSESINYWLKIKRNSSKKNSYNH